ncbi:hypothetical protein [Catellatospora paridis]|uniref:hypothetical protein n=1 Tax=Catellatospora paridis TaxID=1617086 RepID=UPI0012D442B4|nr:hypothetical protein [Catellatospora paridis]
MSYVELRREADGIALALNELLAAPPSGDVAPVDPEDFRQMVWVGEAKLGTETLCEQLEENDVHLPPDIAARIKQFGLRVGADPQYLERIRS